MELLRKVKVKDRLPKIHKMYWTEIGALYFTGKWDSIKQGSTLLRTPEYWYEPITIELKSEEIFDNAVVDKLPELDLADLFSRGHLIDLVKTYHKALEAAELEIARLNAHKKGIMDLVAENQGLKLAIEKGHGGNCIIAPKEEVDKVAKERYEKAYGIIEDINELDTYGGIGFIPINNVVEALKIAAYGTTDSK